MWVHRSALHQRDGAHRDPTSPSARRSSRAAAGIRSVDRTADVGDGEGTRKVSPASMRQVLTELRRISAWIESWLCSTPLGRPVVPEVYMIIRTAPGVLYQRLGGRRSRSSSARVGVCPGCSPRTTTTSGGDGHGGGHAATAWRRSRCRGSSAGMKIIRTSASARMNCNSLVAQRGQDRVDHHAAMRRGQVDDRGLMPVGQHEGHHAAGAASAVTSRRPAPRPAGTSALRAVQFGRPHRL